jgi:hypothetical protein
VDDRQTIDQSRARLTHQKGANLLGALTLVPGDQSRRGLFLRQLRGSKLPELPPASTSSASAAPAHVEAAAGTSAPQTAWPHMGAPAASQPESRVITTPVPDVVEPHTNGRTHIAEVEILDMDDEPEALLPSDSGEDVPLLAERTVSPGVGEADERSANQKHVPAVANARRTRKSARPAMRRRPVQHDDDALESA